MLCKYSLNINFFGLLKCIKHCRGEFTECHRFFCFLCSRQKIELPLMENVQTIPPPYVVRTVLIYSRHTGQLQFNPSEAFSVSLRITDANKSGRHISTSLLWPPLHHQGAIKVLWGVFVCSQWRELLRYHPSLLYLSGFNSALTFHWSYLVLVSCYRRCCSLHIFSLMWSTYTMGWKSRGMKPAGG